MSEKRKEDHQYMLAVAEYALAVQVVVEGKNPAFVVAHGCGHCRRRRRGLSQEHLLVEEASSHDVRVSQALAAKQDYMLMVYKQQDPFAPPRFEVQMVTLWLLFWSLASCRCGRQDLLWQCSQAAGLQDSLIRHEEQEEARRCPSAPFVRSV